MVEKRKPEFILLLKKQSKKNPGKWVVVKIEAFPVQLWPEHCEPSRSYAGMHGGHRYRLRSNGAWFNDDDGKFLAVTITELMRMFRGYLARRNVQAK